MPHREYSQQNLLTSVDVAGFSKIFSTMWGGSLYGRFEASAVFMVLLSLANREGEVDMTPEAIAGTTGWPLDFIKQGIAELASPDPRSRTPDEHGRRITLIDEHREWGWHLTNYQKYRDEMRSQERREYLREAKRKERLSTNVNTSTNVNRVQPIADADADADAEKKELVAKRPFDLFWEAYPKKVKKKDAIRIWQSKRLDAMAGTLVADVKRRLSEDRRWVGGFVCDPPVYLRGERWNDAIEPIEKNGNGIDHAAKEKSQTLDLAAMFGITQGNDDWQTFKAKVDRANSRRIERLRTE